MMALGMDHDCLEHLEYRQSYLSENLDPEVDGAIEHWWGEWWECTVCREKFTGKELDELAEHQHGDPV